MPPAALTFLLLTLAAISAPAWQITPAELAQRRADYSAALQAWDVSDRNLERDLLRLPSPEILTRIESAQQKRAALDSARTRYMEAFHASYQEQVNALKTADAGAADIQALDRRMLEDIAVATGAADVAIRRLGIADRARQRAIEDTRVQLEALAASIRRRDSFVASAQGAELARFRSAALLDSINLDALANIEDPTDYARNYAGMIAQVRQRAGAATPPSPAAPATPAAPTPAAAAAPSPAPPVSSGSGSMVPSIAGTWTYFNPGAAKTGDVYQWLSARAVITQDGDSVRGTYECSYAVPPEEKFNPNVRFAFEGRIVSEVIRFPLKAPMRGYFRVHRIGASELKVSYFIENSGSQGVSFGEIPENDPQTLSRLIR